MSNKEEIEYYILVCKRESLSVRQLRNKIKNNEYHRLPVETKNKFGLNDNLTIIDFVKDPIIINNMNHYEVISEKVLQKLILEDIESFMRELGNSFSFVGSEYKIKVGDTFNYIDLLLFNYAYNCFVVVELKVTELKKEHVGQVLFYMNYVDKNVRRVYQDKTIGIIVCRKNNKYVIEYCSDKRVIARNYELI